MTATPRLVAAALLLAGLTAAGCSDPPAPPAAPPTPKGEEDDDSHDHHPDKLFAHAGKYHLWLRARLSAKAGHELEVFVETIKPPKAAALPVAKFTATAKRDGDEKEYELTFEPTPAAGRPDDPPGTCSHFVAKAPWLTPDDVLMVSAEVEVDGVVRRPKWRKFVPSKYAHRVE
jgi:hypothetical protein